MSELNVFELPVHEDAEIFDMWSDERLDNLATDIKENGFDPRYPLTVSEIDGQWILIDGRNRREACRRINFNPPVYISTIDPKLAIARSNLQNHDQTPGQKAIRWAMLYPGEGKHGGARASEALESNDLGFSDRTLKRARYVWHKNPKTDGGKHPRLAKDVAAGLLTLTEAYELTQRDVKRREEEEAIREANAAKLNDVRARYPNLAALVDDERLSLAQAIASAEQSDRDARDKAERDARDKAEQERIKQEEFARQSKFEEQVAKVRESAPDLADKMQSGRIDFESAMRVIVEREATKKAQDDASLDSFYKFSEIVASYCNEKNANFLKNLLIDNSEYYRDRWRRPIRDSINNVMIFLENKEVYVKVFNEVLKR